MQTNHYGYFPLADDDAHLYGSNTYKKNHMDFVLHELSRRFFSFAAVLLSFFFFSGSFSALSSTKPILFFVTPN